MKDCVRGKKVIREPLWDALALAVMFPTTAHLNRDAVGTAEFKPKFPQKLAALCSGVVPSLCPEGQRGASKAKEVR